MDGDWDVWIHWGSDIIWPTVLILHTARHQHDTERQEHDHGRPHDPRPHRQRPRPSP